MDRRGSRLRSAPRVLPAIPAAAPPRSCVRHPGGLQTRSRCRPPATPYPSAEWRLALIAERRSSPRMIKGEHEAATVAATDGGATARIEIVGERRRAYDA